MMTSLVLLALTLGQPAPEAEAYAVAHVVLREADDWPAFAVSLCEMNPRAVLVSCLDETCPPLDALDCGTPVFLADCGRDGFPMGEDYVHTPCEDPSGAATGALHRARREHRAARVSLLMTPSYAPLRDPRRELIVQADDPVDAILAADCGITDATAPGVRPWGHVRVFASGLPGVSSVRAYGVSASGVRALGPAVSPSAPASESNDQSEVDSE